MVSQKLISFKVDEDILPQLDSLCCEYGIKRNAMLNVLCRIALSCLLGKSRMFNLLAIYSKCF